MSNLNTIQFPVILVQILITTTMFKSVALFGLLFVVIVQADYKHHFTKTAKDCMTELKIDEDTARTFINEHGIPKDGVEVEKFFECCVRTHITDTNEMTFDDSFKHYLTEVFTNFLEGRHKLATILTRECIEHCKDMKGDTKGKTAYKTMKCLMTTFHDMVKKDDE